AVLSLVLLRFMARVAGARAAFWLVAVLTVTPLLAVGATVMTIDPPLVLFWTLAMLAGWRAVQPDGTTGHWLGVGLGMALAFLSKYSAMFQIVCFALFFLFWKPARFHLRRPGPWLALGLFALGTLPVIIWNAQHGWVTVHHVGENAKIDKPWSFTLRYFFEFAGAQAGILNPVFFVGMLAALAGVWKLRRQDALLLYLLCMGAPVFLGYWAYTLHSRVLPNWIAPAVAPLFCLMVIWWDRRWSAGSRLVPRWLATGVTLGAVMVVVLHDTRLIGKISGRYLPPKIDPHRRVLGWKETAALAEAARQQLRTEGRETFIIASHYGLTGQISFYLPEARRAVTTTPLVYYRSSDRPRNQFYFWPGYRQQRPGQNAIYVDEVKPPRLVRGWWKKWLLGQKDIYETDPPRGDPVPREILAEFDSVTDLGVRDVVHRGRVLRRIQLFACRGLRGS
ncbi:MAG TPA: glycosyltransferase family 39 protein, partial [Methylomirabilota bacterium]|nr:glycosyltransferase family 39 protein [Methylomirabilota bacterium]